MSIHGSWDRRVSRGRFLALSGGAAASVALLGPGSSFARGRAAGPYGDLVPDPGGLLDLPAGFQYRIVSQEGERTLRNKAVSGLAVPGDFDGMAAYPGPGNTTVLVRNHEQRGSEVPPVVGVNPYDAKEPGGTTAVVLDPSRRRVDEYVTNAGTRNNCAGGATPWGTWITCEEDRTTGHGYCFEVMWDDPENDLSKTPITGMGFFSHEAVDVDPATGVVYLTEDDFSRVDVVPESDPRVSYLYRYRPHDRSQRPGALQRGGVLEALAIEELVTPRQRTADFFSEGQRFGVVWKPVGAADPRTDAEAQNCVRFNRLEGCHFAGGAFWFDDTKGGEGHHGQVFRLIPGAEGVRGADTLELVLESQSPEESDMPDNLVVTPWGDLWLAEDGEDDLNRLVGLTPDGDTYVFAVNRLNDSELAGPTFSPGGGTFFVNIQSPGITYAVWGPFARRNRTRQRQLAHATPPAGLGPRVSGALREAADRHGLTRLEAAAYDRLGVPLL